MGEFFGRRRYCHSADCDADAEYEVLVHRDDGDIWLPACRDHAADRYARYVGPEWLSRGR